jgi:peroxiredoxin Q/BCP
MKRLLSALTALLAVAGNSFAKDAVLLPIGSIAPDFSLPGDSGDTVTLSEFRGQSAVVLIFYPGDETPVCTQQLCEIRDNWSQFGPRGAKVFGVNPAGAASHKKFSTRHKLPFLLLIDKDKIVARRYGTASAVIQKRTVYVIDRDGKIAFAKRGKPPVAEILSAVPAASEAAKSHAP